MITFLPYVDFEETARCLDMRRLGKQRVEAMSLLKIIAADVISNHPAVLMWEEAPMGLALYGITMCEEWIDRGYKDTTRDRIIDLAATIAPDTPIDAMTQYHAASQELLPQWLGQHKVHQSHKSNLLRKEPGHYRPLWPFVPDDLPYYWPVTKEQADA